MESEKLKNFLQRIWGYTSTYAVCYAVMWKKKSSVHYKHYCLPFSKPTVSDNVTIASDYDDLYDKVVNDVNELAQRDGIDVYFQVLPLSQPPRTGRGKAKDVSVAKFLFVDLDYKREVIKPDFEGCVEGEDHALVCFYREDDKIFKCERPELKKVLDQIEIEPSIVVDSGCGYHLYFELETEIDAEKFSVLENKLIRYLKVKGVSVDESVKDLARVLRLPETVNQRVKRAAHVIYESEKKYSVDEIDKLVEEEKPQLQPQGFRLLTDGQLIQIKELIKDAYKEGSRQALVLYLSGWFAKAMIDPRQTMRLIRILHDETNDKDPLRERLAGVVYSYKKAGIDIDKFSADIEREFGVKPYGLESEIKESEIKGFSGVQEILEKRLDEERALDVIRQLEEILNTASPYTDSVIEILDWEKQLYAVANLKNLNIARAKLSKEGLKYKERIAIGAPVIVEVYNNPIGGVTKYRVVWQIQTRPRPLEIGPAPIKDIIDRLDAEGLITNSRLAKDVINAIIEGFIRKGRAIMKSEIEAPGFYFINGKITAVGYEIGKVDTEELRDALLFLDEIAKWYSHMEKRFAKVIKWVIVAPFDFIYKQKGMWLKWLYIYGTAGSGKTTLGEVAISMWGLDSRYIKGGSNVDSPARLGYVLSQSTFPVLVNEPGNVFNKEDMIELIKNAVENTVARGKYIHGSYTEIPSLAPLIITSNKGMPPDDALTRRFIKIMVSLADRESIEARKQEFDTKIKPNLRKLSVIGKFVANYVLETQQLKENWENFAVELLELAYKTAGLPIPEWVYLDYEEVSEENIKVEILDTIWQKITDAYIQYYGKIAPSDKYSNQRIRIREIITQVVNSRLLPGVYIKMKDNIPYVAFSKKFADELFRQFPQISTLKSLSELFGWHYGQERFGEESLWVAMTELDRFIDMLTKEES